MAIIPEDRVALVTGSTDGVGRAVAIALGRNGWLVLAHGRNAERGARVVADITDKGGRALFYEADLSSMSGTRRFAETVGMAHPKLGLLINNAGLGYGARGAVREVSPDGFELRLAVNYLAPFLLTRMLLLNLISTASSRIVNVSSNAQGEIDFDDLCMENAYSGRDAYRRSKLALTMFTFDLAEELKARDVCVNAVHPASAMDTAMVREAGMSPTASIEEGADAILSLAISEKLAGQSGVYFDMQRPAQALQQAYDRNARKRLRRISMTLTGAPE